MKNNLIPSGLLAATALFVLSANSVHAQLVTTPNAFSGTYNSSFQNTGGASATSTPYHLGIVTNINSGTPTPPYGPYIASPYGDGNQAIDSTYINISNINNPLGLDELQIYTGQESGAAPSEVKIWFLTPTLANPTAANTSLSPSTFGSATSPNLTLNIPVSYDGYGQTYYATATTGPEHSDIGTPGNGSILQTIGYVTLTSTDGFIIPADVTSLLFQFTSVNSINSAEGNVQIDQLEAFGPAVATPEPSTWALLLCGLGMLVVLNRRRSLQI